MSELNVHLLALNHMLVDWQTVVVGVQTMQLLSIFLKPGKYTN